MNYMMNQRMNERERLAEEIAHPIYEPGEHRAVFVYGFKRGWDARDAEVAELVAALEKIEVYSRSKGAGPHAGTPYLLDVHNMAIAALSKWAGKVGK